VNSRRPSDPPRTKIMNGIPYCQILERDITCFYLISRRGVIAVITSTSSCSRRNSERLDQAKPW